MNISIKQRGDWKRTTEYLKKAQRIRFRNILEQYGSAGVLALSKATPKDTGLTASSWNYKLELTSKGYSLSWFNTNEVHGTPIVVLIMFGHGTGTGGYIPPRDFVNPAIQPVMDALTEEIMKEVSSL